MKAVYLIWFDPVWKFRIMTVRTFRQQLTLKTRKSITLPSRPPIESTLSVVPVNLGRRSRENSDLKMMTPLVPVA